MHMLISNQISNWLPLVKPVDATIIGALVWGIQFQFIQTLFDVSVLNSAVCHKCFLNSVGTLFLAIILYQAWYFFSHPNTELYHYVEMSFSNSLKSI